jgi:hypothetical protein
MRGLAIVALCALAAVTYGVAHDQVTARICVEYFTVGHEPIFDTDDPTLLGLGWGVLATWWVGLILGIPLALVARVGPWPKRTPRSLVRPVAGLMMVTAIGALAAGVLGWLLGRNGAVVLAEPLATEVPADNHVAFLAALWSHSASYLFGFVGGVVVIVRVARSRRRLAGNSSGPTKFQDLS